MLLMGWNNGCLLVWRLFKKHTLLHIRALKLSHVNKVHIFQYISILCGISKVPLKFHTNILTIHWKIWFHTILKFLELLCILKCPQVIIIIMWVNWSIICFDSDFLLIYMSSHYLNPYWSISNMALWNVTQQNSERFFLLKRFLEFI